MFLEDGIIHHGVLLLLLNPVLLVEFAAFVCVLGLSPGLLLSSIYLSMHRSNAYLLFEAELDAGSSVDHVIHACPTCFCGSTRS